MFVSASIREDNSQGLGEEIGFFFYYYTYSTHVILAHLIQVNAIIRRGEANVPTFSGRLSAFVMSFTRYTLHVAQTWQRL